ncbi:MAG: DinB family protein [Fimbriimonadaceae bacterium]
MDKEFFEGCLDYEAWANEQWMNTLVRFEDRKRATAIMQHIVGCYGGWITKMDDWTNPDDEDIDLERDMPDLLRRWRRVLRENSLDTPYDFQSRSGKDRQILLSEVLHHVLNHGTYHRGQLRGLAEAEGMVDFPETDIASFYVLRRAGELN